MEKNKIEENSFWINLSPDLWVHILLFLDNENQFLNGFNLSCKKFHFICQKEVFWMKWGEKTYKWFKKAIESNNLKALEYFKQLRTISFGEFQGTPTPFNGYTKLVGDEHEIVLKFKSVDSLCLATREFGETERCYWEIFHLGNNSSRLGKNKKVIQKKIKKRK